jgi:hypothetical protein
MIVSLIFGFVDASVYRMRRAASPPDDSPWLPQACSSARGAEIVNKTSWNRRGSVIRGG